MTQARKPVDFLQVCHANATDIIQRHGSKHIVQGFFWALTKKLMAKKTQTQGK